MRDRNIYILFLMILATITNASAQDSEATLSADSLVTLDGKLDSIYRNLPEVMIVGERPVVKAQKGKLVYDLPRMIIDKPVDNVYDAIKQLPGVSEMNDGIQLAGQPVTVMIDGKVSTMSGEQFTSLLKGMPSSRIANAEVLYNAPARYHVRGALINITLKHAGQHDLVQGEAFAKASVKHYENFVERSSFVYNHDKLSLDMLYSHDHGRGYFVTEKRALHSLNDGSKYDIANSEAKRHRDHTHSLRIGADYKISDKNTISLVYNANYSTAHIDMRTEGTQDASNYNRNRNWMHNVRLDYSAPAGIKAGVEMTYYNTPSRQNLESKINDETLSFNTEEGQRINRWRLFASREHQLKNGLDINYGVVYNTSIDHSYQYYHDLSDMSGSQSSQLDDMKSRKTEHTLNMYAGLNKSFGSKLSLDASIAVEQYKTAVWNQWDWYPTLNLNYMPADGHVLQFSLSSDRNYPNYWAVQNSVSFLGGGYSEIHGNPRLKPTQDYQAEFTYILRSKYVFTAWFEHAKDYSVQTLYQSPDRLVEIYKYLNFDYQQKAGLQASIPVRPLKWIDSRFTIMGIWHHEKDADFWDIPFNRSIVYGIAVMNNTFKLSSTPDLTLMVNGMIRSKAIQGIYDLPASGNLSAALRYAFAKGKGIISIYCNDVFETNQISPRIRFMDQNVTNHYSSFREVGVTFTYKFGGYKEKKRDDVDTSRFK